MYFFFLLTLLFPAFAQASDFYLNLGAGGAFHQATTGNGTWKQDGQPYQFKLDQVGLKAGLGYRLNKDWALEVDYLYLGKVGAQGFAINDDDYDMHTNGCKKHSKNCGPMAFSASDRVQMIDLMARRNFDLWGVQPFLKAGGFYALHNLDYYVQMPSGKLDGGTYRGAIYGVAGGGGVCWKWLCGEATWYQGLGSSEYPIARNIFAPMVSLNIPL